MQEANGIGSGGGTGQSSRSQSKFLKKCIIYCIDHEYSRGGYEMKSKTKEQPISQTANMHRQKDELRKSKAGSKIEEEASISQDQTY